MNSIKHGRFQYHHNIMGSEYRQEVVAWCIKNIDRDDFMHCATYRNDAVENCFVFASQEDYVLFQLTWG